MISMLYAIAEATSSESWLILDSVRTLKVEIVVVRLHLSRHCVGSVADFSDTVARTGTAAERAPCLPARRAMRYERLGFVRVMLSFDS